MLRQLTLTSFLPTQCIFGSRLYQDPPLVASPPLNESYCTKLLRKFKLAASEAICLLYLYI